MDREKQIDEMQVDLMLSIVRSSENGETRLGDTARNLYNAGYRKQSKGEWEKFEGERFICSNCAKVFGLGSTATIYDVKRVWKYCPNCGAKMKGGAE